MSQEEGKSKRSTPKLAVVIMAAGKGTRLKSRRPKVLHEVGGKPLLSHVIATAGRLAEARISTRSSATRRSACVKRWPGTGVQFIEQKEQRGTGHAIQCAREAIAGYEHILVLSGDVPLIQADTLQHLMTLHLGGRRGNDDTDCGAGRSPPAMAGLFVVRWIGRKWTRSSSRRR